MSKNVFDKIQDVTTNVSKNTFDWSHANNFTGKIGKIMPIFCEQLPAGSSIKINPTFALKFMPMMFPIQTRLKAYMSFFRVPLRALWTDYADFISSPNSDSTLVAPYLSTEKTGDQLYTLFRKGEIMGVSGLSDYLGVPVTYTLPAASALNVVNQDNPVAGYISTLPENIKVGSEVTISTAKPTMGTSTARVRIGSNWPDDKAPGTEMQMCRVVMHLYFNYNNAEAIIPYIKNYAHKFFITTYNSNYNKKAIIKSLVPLLPDDDHFIITDLNDGHKTLDLCWDVPVGKYDYIDYNCIASPLVVDATTFNFKGAKQGVQLFDITPINSAPMSVHECPYYGFCDTEKQQHAIKLSAYPYRAYEAIYNGYMRNIRNNPFMINGKPVYNRFIPVNTGGADNYEYKMYSANWASDAFTTAVPSPQQGTQPLVGLTTYAEQVPQGGSVTTVLKTALVDEDGNKYKVSYKCNDNALTGVSYEKLSDDTAVSPISSLYNLLQSGISINDFRNVNAYQRYLELNMFKGYSYRQIVEGRFDCTVHYDTLLLPEYLGGITRDVTINPVTQMIEVNGNGTYNGALGSQAGNGTCFGNSEYTIKGFCDEESIVMGLLTVVPMPVYTQPIPKFFLYRDRLDTFNPEFDHIGYQPIYTKELCPVNQWLADSSKMNTVFGYQRPWYEYCQKRDTAHGLFRTELRNFIMNRVFAGVPELGQEFTTVDENTVNDVFSVTDVSDKILGQVYFDCTVKLPISRVVVPRLE